MLKNLNITNGIFFSQRVLLELTEVGFTREEAYKLVQKNAMKSWKENSSFLSNILLDKKITNKIPVNKLKKLFNFANTSIDISDGLFADLDKLINKQKLSYKVNVSNIPTSKNLKKIWLAQKEMKQNQFSPM